MKFELKDYELISNMREFYQLNESDQIITNEEPIRAELYNSAQMERFGTTLAGTHKVSTIPSKDYLLKRLSDNEIKLQEVRKLVTDSIKKKLEITSTGEWLVDNFYLIEENIHIAKKHFPKNYSEGLPHLVDEIYSGLPRIYDIALQNISHCDGIIDIEILSRYIKAYQKDTKLKLGELWALPIMLRLALIENLRRVAVRVAVSRLDRNLADFWSKKMIETAEKSPKDLILVIADMARTNPPMVSGFVSEFIRKLQGHKANMNLVHNWVENRLSEIGLSISEVVYAENQKQAALQISMSNIIGSLRLLDDTDWRNFVEELSIVEQTLREDKIYGLMDFSTRDRYRHVVEQIAKKSKIEECDVAQAAINLSQKNIQDKDKNIRTSHVGYYLIGNGINQTKKSAGIQEPGIKRIFYFIKKNAFKAYLAIIILITLAISTGIVDKASSETNNFWLLLTIAILSLLCISQFAISVVNFFSTLFIKPDLLPRMDFSNKIPPEFSTLVVIPTILLSKDKIENLVEALEVRFLANRNDNLHFGLLTDFKDSKQEKLSEDQSLIDLAQQKIEQLNLKYERENNNLFYLFHRPRLWNAQENIWMGYERKRGKIYDLNSLLRGESKDKFSLIEGDQSILPDIKYVITLDEDTQLPLGTAWKLIGTMAHPLNQAFYDEKKKLVTQGYGILQPRVSASLPDTISSLYTKMHGNEPGIDPYTRVTSDVYQDLFGEGSFIGKGIYEVDIFRKVLEFKFPENQILSHDLLEGSYARSGLLSDVQFFEKYPISYFSDMKRYSRWIRGDWQIFPWVLPVAPDSDRHWHKNPISGLSRWKIFDNLRRSLVPLALTLFLLIGWIALPSTLFWTLIVSCIILAPIFIASLWNMINKPEDLSFSDHIRNSLLSIAEILNKTLFTFITLPYEAFLYLAAILRTLWRMLISKRNLLEWNPSSNEKRNNNSGIISSYSVMWIEPCLALVVFFYLLFLFPLKLVIAGPILFLWLITPLYTWWISKPTLEKVSILSNEQNIFLRKTARKTYSYFEQFVGDEDNWLPPDNFQELPVELIAHRTSPTNIGLSLLANLSACEFGFINSFYLIERTTKSINTMFKMERFKGHFFNWYDTKTLAHLSSKYISTVDSGNLAGYLLIMKQGLLAIPDKNLFGSKTFEGLRDTLNVLLDTMKIDEIKLLNQFKLDIDLACKSNLTEYQDIKYNLEILKKDFYLFIEQFKNNPNNKAHWWIQILKAQLDRLNDDLQIFKPWDLLKNAPYVIINADPENSNKTLKELLESARKLQIQVNEQKRTNSLNGDIEWYKLLTNSISQTIQLASEKIQTLENLAEQCNSLSDMEWDFLFDKSSNLFNIGYNADEHCSDKSYYDLLASEARLCPYLGIVQGKLPLQSWFALGRLLTRIDGNQILLSWSGSMFEYLMPLLIMPTFENTLLDQTYKAVVEYQINYGRRLNLPWGISESGFNLLNANNEYQYRAFGAPGLGLKRGLDNDMVIAPYASVLALMVDPANACENLEQLSKLGMNAQYGFYEAIDYTPSRLENGQDSAIIYSFMAHHQGMSLLSLANLLLDKPMQKYFKSEPQFKAGLLLLQERIPETTVFFAHTTEIPDLKYVGEEIQQRIFNTPDTPLPEVQLLSNGRYNVLVSNSGSGYSFWKELAVTRWREDGTCDNWGSFCYIRDLKNNKFWSNSYQPTLRKGEKYEAVFSQDRVDIRTVNNEIESHTEIAVSPEDDIEMRRLHIYNNSQFRKVIEVTSYAEVVLAPLSSDLSGPAFSNLFVQTKILEDENAIICTRRPRSQDEQTPWMFHMMSLKDKVPEEISYESDRMEFIGRGNSLVNPKVMQEVGPLSGNEGSVLDPIVAIRYKFILEKEETITIDMVTGIADTKENCRGLIDKYQDRHNKDRVYELARTHSQVVLRQIDATEADAQLYEHLAGSIIFNNSNFRADPSILIKNHRKQSDLWAYSISGDLPIILLRIVNKTNIQLIKKLLQAHTYWSLKGLKVDLVIWNEEQSGYRQDFQKDIEALIPPETRNRPGGIFLRAADQISTEDRILFQTVARIYIVDNGRTLADITNLEQQKTSVIPRIKQEIRRYQIDTSISLPNDLIFFNGYGGFSSAAAEYVIITDQKNRTPAPWVNVISNPKLGTVISESGSAYTWSENAHEFRLTPWSNDPVSDSGGEAYYIRDDESGNFWSASLFPSGGKTPYITRHGFGYSKFEHIEDGIYSEMLVYTDIEEAVKFTVLKIRNQSGRSRKLSATGYVEWVLGGNRTNTMMHIHTEIDPDSGALFAKNPFSTEFRDRVAFFDVDEPNKSFTANRKEFIGRNGNLTNPDAMSRLNLSGTIGLALDPCAAIQVPFVLADGDEHEIVFRLGAGQDFNNASLIAMKFRGKNVALNSFEKVKKYWSCTTEVIKVETPDEAINLLTNGWLTYQTLSSRLWARSGFYQSGGAFGFRDQLQDVLSLLYTAPQLAREQILLCASRQFKEGDVQHWWHPPVGRGVRTRCSDDFLWLPFVVSHYISVTGDTQILDVPVRFLEGPLLNSDQESYYDLPAESGKSTKLYDHCIRAIRNGFKFGIHGLPLIGTGDWNDGYDKVGNEGKGESVWLAFFQYDILIRFSEIANLQKDSEFAEECINKAQQLKSNIDKNAWDGEWYKRAWFDNGTPLGSKVNDDCQIDSIVQSWSVLSGAGESDNINIAIESAYNKLVEKETGIIKLLKPPFDMSKLNPGYIKGYVPGIRENGGQYTHAAVWLIKAFAELGDYKRVWELLNMINPINHGKTSETIAVYKVEPYVLAADVYSGMQHAGRGGWTWYTGSASWLYLAVLESFLGLKKESNKLKLNPCIPKDWKGFKISYRYNKTIYKINVTQISGTGNTTVIIDGIDQKDNWITLVDDEFEHDVQVRYFVKA
ncbi:MAG TPA: glucoamylase family protein [Ignavibacteria bacterium]|nr:glucoamylase family protein [Ignavibacteria bacterium]